MAVNYGQVAIVPKGEWNVETQYKVNNLVSYDGSSYVAKVQPPIGTLPTDTSYWQVSAAGTKKATADSLGTVMPDGTTTSVGEGGKLSVNTAQQDALGVVKGSDDITVGEDGTLAVNTTFEQATELANIIAGEAIKSVLGKVSKAIATTMSLDENALLKNMISGIDVNDSNKVPSSAYIHTLVERIGMGTELVSGLGDLTTGLNTVNNNLSKWKFQGDTIQFDVGTNSEAPLFFKIRSTETDFYQLTALSGGLELSKTENGAWTSLWKAATKSDLPKYKDVPIDLSTLTFSPNIGGYVCITKIADLIGTFTTVLSATVVRWSNLTSDTSVMLDGSGFYLTIRQDTDSKKGNITVRFVYV